MGDQAPPVAEGPATYMAQLFYLWPFGTANSSPALQPMPTLTDMPKLHDGLTEDEALQHEELPPSFISSVLLSYWDDLSGPRIVRAWPPVREETKDAMLRIARHTLCSDIERTPSDDIEPRLHVLGDQGMVVSTFVFWATNPGHAVGVPPTNIFSLSIMSSVSQMQAHMAFYPFFQDRMPLIIARFTRTRKHVLGPAGVVPPSVPPLSHRQQVHANSLARLSERVKQVLSEVAELTAHNLCSEIGLADTIFGSEYEGTLTDRSFIWRAFASHLQTNGRTVVLGVDPPTINVFINSLALLLPDQHRRLSRRLNKDFNRYIPDIYLQGIVLTDDRSVCLPDARVLESRTPTTVVDLSRFTVEQTWVQPTYTRTRDDYIKLELDKIGPDGLADVTSILQQNALFRPVKATAAMIRELITHTYALPYGLRRQYMGEFNRILGRRAVALLQAFDDVRAHVDPSYQQYAISVGMRRVRQELGMEDDILFSIVLARADRMRPGVFELMSEKTGEDQFLEVMNNF